jgi:hypothetical protein
MTKNIATLGPLDPRILSRRLSDPEVDFIQPLLVTIYRSFRDSHTPLSGLLNISARTLIYFLYTS